MYAVIFTAEFAELDAEYDAMGTRMRERAITEFGCRDFEYCSDSKHEIAISYWDSKEQIQAWRNDPQHQEAQRLGREKWYKSYRVRLVEVIR